MSLVSSLASLVLLCRNLVSAAYDRNTLDGLTQLITFNEEMGNISLQDRVLYITYRGTENASDWMADLNVTRKSVTGGSVHKGCFDKFFDVSPDLTTQVNKLVGTFDTVVVTGHSLGAGLATYAADLLRDALPANIKLYLIVFSPFRFGNTDYRAYFRSKDIECYAFASEDDTVPAAPLSLKQVVNPFYLNFQGVNPLDQLTNHSIDSFEPVLRGYFNV